jgi:hypothetical protein
MRHVDEMKVTKNFEDKDNFQWEEEDVFTIINHVIQSANEDIQSFLKRIQTENIVNMEIKVFILKEIIIVSILRKMAEFAHFTKTKKYKLPLTELSRSRTNPFGWSNFTVL